MQSLDWNGNHWLESTPSHELPTNKWSLLTLTISPHYNHLQITWHICSWVEIHVGLMLMIISIVDEWVRWGSCMKKSSIDQIMGCFGSEGVNSCTINGYWSWNVHRINIMLLCWFWVICQWNNKPSPFLVETYFVVLDFSIN